MRKRDQLLDKALELFHAEGFHATGIDRIIAEAGVAKMTLYKHFRSKDELILAVLRRYDEQFRNYLMQQVELRTPEPSQQLIALFDVLDDWLDQDGFCGCPMINACAEFSNKQMPAHVVASEHKRLLLLYIQEIAEAAEASDPPVLAQQLGLLMDGAIVAAQVCGQRRAARVTHEIAQLLIHQSRSRPSEQVLEPTPSSGSDMPWPD